MPALIDIRVTAIPNRHAVEHTYSIVAGRSGLFDFYADNGRTKDGKNRLSSQPSTLEEALKLLQNGFAARFKANGPTYFGTSVFSKSTQRIVPIYL